MEFLTKFAHPYCAVEGKQVLGVGVGGSLRTFWSASAVASRIGAVVILGADHRIIGILSERDIVRALAEHGPIALNKPISQFMTRDVKTCSEDDTVGNLMGYMTAGKFRHMPVVQKESLIGIVSIGDVVKNRIEEIALEGEALRQYIYS